MEDKIIGPLTLIQFLYILGGGVVNYLLFMAFGSSSFIFWLLALPIAIVALALAFLKIQDQPLLYFIKAGLIYLQNPKKRIWLRQGIQPKIIRDSAKKVVTAPLPPKRQIEKSELEKLAQMLDTQRVSRN